MVCMDLFILVTCTVAITYATNVHIIFTVIVAGLVYLFLRALSPAAMDAAEEPLAEEKGEKVARPIAKAAEAESTTRESTQDGSTPFGDAEASEANEAANKEFNALQHKALASAVDGGVPCKEDDALALRLLQGGSYTSSRAKRFLDLVRASYSRSATYDGRSWQRIDVSGAESVYNMRVIGKVLSDSERNSVKPPPPVNAAMVVEVCFRGSVFVGEEGGFNLDNWCRVNLNPGVGLSKGKAGWLPDLTPLDKQIGEASPLDGAQVHAGFQNAYIEARGSVMKWLNEQREHPNQRLHISCCGHSLGAALATLLALDVGSTGHDSVELVTWASPRVGDKAFCNAFAKIPVARFTCGADVVPRLPPEKLGFEHVCPEMRLDAWVTSAMSVVTGESLSSHGIDVHAINLENCFRDPLAVVRTSDGGWRLTNSYSSTALATIYVGTGVDIVPTVAGWLFANEKVLKRLDGVQDQLQLQLNALQDRVDSVSGCLLRSLQESLQEQDIKHLIRQLRSEVNALMEGAKLRGDDLDFQRLRVSQHNLLDIGKEIWSARDARSKHGPLMLDLLITSYSTELELLRRASRLEDVEERGRRRASTCRLARGWSEKNLWKRGDAIRPHLYLAIVATDPGLQGKGHVPRLLRAVLRIADAAGLPIYLECGGERPEDDVEERGRQIDQLVRSILPAIAATMSSGSFSRLKCPALDCLLPQLLIGRVPPLPPDQEATDAFWEKAGSAEEEVRRSTSLSWRCKRLVAGDARIVAYLLVSPVTEVLKALDLYGNKIGDEGAAAIAEALRDNAVLIELYLRNNRIGNNGAKALASALCANAVLTTLDLSRNKMCGVDECGEGEYDASGVVALADALKVNQVLSTLDLSRNKMCGVDECGEGEYDASGVVALADALKVNEVLTDLNLSGSPLFRSNDIGPEGVAAIAEALKVNEVLTRLNLSANDIGPDGAKAIGKALAVNAVLTDLNLGLNNIGDEGAKALAAALRDNEVLKVIDLRYNNLVDEPHTYTWPPRGRKGVIRDAVRGREGFKLEI